MNDAQRRRFWVVVLGAGVEGSLIGLAWLAGWLLGQPPLKHFSWSLPDAAWGVAASLPMLAGAYALMRWPVGPLARISQFSKEVIRPLFASCTLLDLALISLLAGLGEEMFFRGVLQPILGRWLGPWPGLALASVLFGLVHPITGTYVILAAVIGAYLGYVFDLSRNLLLVIIAHALYDFVVLVFLLRPARQDVLVAPASPGRQSPEGASSGD